MKPVNFFSVQQDGKAGLECELCGDRFFDQKAQNGRMLTSSIDKAVHHGRNYHPMHRAGRIGIAAPSEQKGAAR